MTLVRTDSGSGIVKRGQRDEEMEDKNKFAMVGGRERSQN